MIQLIEQKIKIDAFLFSVIVNDNIYCENTTEQNFWNEPRAAKVIRQVAPKRVGRYIPAIYMVQNTKTMTISICICIYFMYIVVLELLAAYFTVAVETFEYQSRAESIKKYSYESLRSHLYLDTNTDNPQGVNLIHLFMQMRSENAQTNTCTAFIYVHINIQIIFSSSYATHI